MDLEKIFEKVGKVSLRGGIFGKLTWAIIVICICVTAIALATRNLYVEAAAIALMMAFAFIFFWRLLNFAEKHPLVAILEGSEFLTHERMVQAAKDQGVLPPQPNAIDHAQPSMDTSAIEVDEVQEPKQIEGQ
ncbi:MAG: hypothetical protein KGQ26_10530 [Rhodospirillales bacterium]|nr:hypothetical protein [Rhodospirillales bacterium]MDE2318393.1 hypothetical protein [Rhodospirillales bacterium]